MKLGLLFSILGVGSIACAASDDVVARGGDAGGAGFTSDASAPRTDASNPPVAIDGGADGCAGDGCLDACAQADKARSSEGCEYYPVAMAAHGPGDGGCFAVFVSNRGDVPAKLTTEFHGTPIDLAAHARLPVGSGASLAYEPYDPAVGVPPKRTAILFLAYHPEHKIGGLMDPMDAAVECPVPAAVVDGSAQFPWTGRGHAFHLVSDQPVVAYQMLPYGGGSAAITGATLLIPTSAWDTNYIAASATKASSPNPLPPTVSIVAMHDGTVVTLVPKGDIQAWGMGSDLLTPTPANVPVSYVLDRGQHLQFVEQADLSGSPIEANQPIGVYGGHYCMNLPNDTPFCDHAEQQIPAVRALGWEYAAVGHRARTDKPENRRWRVVSAVADTQLSFEGAPIAAPVLSAGDVFEFETDSPFVVKSQDEQHPFLLFAYMKSSRALDDDYGDPDFVRIVPPAQFLESYVFFTDPTYPETNLVVVRARKDGSFSPVTLDCAGVLTGWQPLGASGDYEYTRIDLSRHDFEPQNGCDNGQREMWSEGKFGVWVWGWGTPETSQGECNSDLGIYTCHVSYGYPAGEGLELINEVRVPPVPH